MTSMEELQAELRYAMEDRDAWMESAFRQATEANFLRQQLRNLQRTADNSASKNYRLDDIWPRPRMFVCSICGNKRCPHANDERFACTGSNEPGQPGSAY